jgi:hypothetical protein
MHHRTRGRRSLMAPARFAVGQAASRGAGRGSLPECRTSKYLAKASQRTTARKAQIGYAAHAGGDRGGRSQRMNFAGAGERVRAPRSIGESRLRKLPAGRATRRLALIASSPAAIRAADKRAGRARHGRRRARLLEGVSTVGEPSRWPSARAGSLGALGHRQGGIRAVGLDRAIAPRGLARRPRERVSSTAPTT